MPKAQPAQVFVEAVASFCQFDVVIALELSISVRAFLASAEPGV